MSKPISAQLRDAIDAAQSGGISRYRISLGTEIPQSQLSRFMAKEVGLSLDAIDRLCEFLDLRLTSDKPKSKTKE